MQHRALKTLVTVYGSLAQLVEQLAFNQLVTGSNPVRPTINTYQAEANSYKTSLGSL